MATHVRNFGDVAPVVRQSIHGGDGELEMRFPFAPGEFATALRTFELLRIPPGASVAEHVHVETEEVYHVLSGQGTMWLDGEERPIRQGDVILTQPPSRHSVRNTGGDSLDLLIVEVDVASEEAER